ncbi:MAG: DUF4430 domain-containing protein [Lachnospiraceae bacterium]|nr:DUF4430 domain-containing protein [Lachnospiraceae bacterium]
MEKGNKKTIFAIAAVIIAAILMFILYQTFMPKGSKGDKTITVTVVHGDGSQKEFTCKTQEAYLDKVLVAEAIVEDNPSDYGLYILVADGEEADEGSQEWWCITKGGESVNTGASDTPIEDGDCFELTLTTGY